MPLGLILNSRICQEIGFAERKVEIKCKIKDIKHKDQQEV